MSRDLKSFLSQKAQQEREEARSSPDMFDSPSAQPDDAHDLAGSELDQALSWRGVSMEEIYGSSSPWTAPHFPAVAAAYNHCVLYQLADVPPDGRFLQPPPPHHGKDVWDKDHVRMPYSPHNVYPVKEENGSGSLRNRWELIVQALSRPMRNCAELQAAILHYNTKYEKHWNFTALRTLFDEYLEEEETQFFFDRTLPSIAKLALRLPQLVPNAIPLLRQHHNRSISLSQLQVSCLLANAFFCTFPRRNSPKAKSEYGNYPDINFYRRVTTNVPCGVMTFTRRTVEQCKCPDWLSSHCLLGSVPLHVDSQGIIEDQGKGLLQVDFANKYLGGGVLGGGCVQEEIRFVICPELLVSMLFTEVLRPTEALLMIGSERYSDYSGYASSFCWSGDHVDETPFDSSGRRRCAIIAIDALSFNNPAQQYKPELIERELNKAWVGYSVHAVAAPPGVSLPAVGTGNWGCGAFRGSPHLKALLQLMACCLARRPMVYYTFGNEQLRDDIANMYNFLSRSNITIAVLFDYLRKFRDSHAPPEQLYPYILQRHRDLEARRQQKDAKASCDVVNSAPSTHKSKDPVAVKVKPPEEDAMNISEESESELQEVLIDEATGPLQVKSQVDKQDDSVSLLSAATLLDQENCERALASDKPAKKRMALAYFEPDSAPLPAGKPVEPSLTGATPASIFRFPGHSKNSGKISDYFQRVQRK